MLGSRRKRSGPTGTSRLRPTLWLVAALVVLSCVTLPVTVSAETPSGYNEHDYNKLRAFLDQTDGMRTNGDKINPESYRPDRPDTWAGVTWIERTSGNKRVMAIDWSGMGLVGNLDLTGCSALERLDCGNNQLSELDVSECTSLAYLYCHQNQLTSLDVSDCTNLETLGCGNNQLSELNVSNCSSLVSLGCSDNQLDSLDVNNCPDLLELYCYNNQLTELDVRDCADLLRLSCFSNQLESLDVSECTALVTLHCNANQLTSLNVSGLTSLENLYCQENQLTLADLPPSLPVPGGEYVYAPQADIVIGSGGIIAPGEEIDLSAEARVGGVDTVFTWYNAAGTEVAPATASGGKFTFGEELGGQTIYCEMANPTFPDLILKTISVVVKPGPTHQITIIKGTDGGDESDPLNISSGSLWIAQIDGDMGAVSEVTVSVDGGEKQQAAVAGNTVYYLLPAGLEDGEHTITIELTTEDGQKISESITFYWDNYRRGFGFGRFYFGDVDTP